MAAASGTPKRNRYDVVIVGGAIYGSAVAWFTARDPGFDGSILVVERDPSYEFSSTAHTNSCMRQQFSSEINVRISQFAADFVKNLREHFGGDERVADIAIRNFGYMYLADTAEANARLVESQKIQAACGSGTRHLTPAEIAREYPFYNLEDVVGGNLNTLDEGYFDGGTLFDSWRRSAGESGVEYVANEVVAMTRNRAGDRVETVTLKSGELIACGTVVNASGPRAAWTAKMAGIDIPVEPRKRFSFVFSAEKPLDRDLPLTIDPSGIHMRTDTDATYLAGCPPTISGGGDPAVAYDDFEFDPTIWEDHVWPIIANRIPQFVAIRLNNFWVGHYAFNTLDQNAVLGPHTGVKNFVFVNGFSGHGLQQAPAMARGVAELIVYGEYRSLDLSPFAYDRIERNEPFRELAVI